MSHILNLLLQQTYDLPLTINHLTVEVDDNPKGKRRKCISQVNTPNSDLNHNAAVKRTATWYIATLSCYSCDYECVYSQEDACSHKQEERVFHQVGVSTCQHGQVRVIFFQFVHPALP